MGFITMIDLNGNDIHAPPMTTVHDLTAHAHVPWVVLNGEFGVTFNWDHNYEVFPNQQAHMFRYRNLRRPNRPPFFYRRLELITQIQSATIAIL